MLRICQDLLSFVCWLLAMSRRVVISNLYVSILCAVRGCIHGVVNHGVVSNWAVNHSALVSSCASSGGASCNGEVSSSWASGTGCLTHLPVRLQRVGKHDLVRRIGMPYSLGPHLLSLGC